MAIEVITDKNTKIGRTYPILMIPKNCKNVNEVMLFTRNGVAMSLTDEKSRWYFNPLQCAEDNYVPYDGCFVIKSK